MVLTFRKIIPPKQDEEDPERDGIVRIVADQLQQQGKSDEAAKLFLDIGDAISALKAIITGGNAAKIVKFANFARTPEAYVLAANFLQNLDWQNKPKLIKYIVTFYTKAKRYDAAANFYVGCAMLEIDEYKNYEKALKAIEVGKKHAEKGSDTSLISKMEEKVRCISEYISAKEKLKSDPEAAIDQLKDLTQDSQARDALRIGDVYSTIFEYYASKGEGEKAWGVVEEMKEGSFQIRRYLDVQYVILF